MDVIPLIQRRRDLSQLPSWYSAHISPRSTRSFVIVFFAIPVILTVARMLMPSVGQPMTWARFSALNRLILAFRLEAPDRELAPKVGNWGFFRKLGRYAGRMPSAHDVAKYILEQKGEMDTWKLQKLVYYSQAWHLVWDSEPLFDDPIEAWANGPVVPALYREHRGKFKMRRWPKGNVSRLTKSQRESIDVVLRRYGKRTGFALREQTHSESPWKDAHKGVPAGAPSSKVVTHGAMTTYYGSL
ncbi:MAG TPA: type II toxin-antitoxin system antitoxin SocA domain-containing protein [Solirubrobacteraceae bacterium]